MKKIEATLFASKAKNYLGTPYKDKDHPDGLQCDGLIEACLGDCGYKVNWSGTNTMARTPGVFAWLGTPEDCKAEFGCIPVGACPMIWANDGGEAEKYRNDGIGNYNHIGMKTGTGLGAIHASSSKKSVCESSFADKTIKNGGWNRVGLLAMLDYGAVINHKLYDETPEVVVNETVPMYASASASSRVLMYAEEGTYVVLYDDDLGPVWTHVSIDEIDGYIQSKYLRKVEEQVMKGVIVSKNGKSVNFRKKPSTLSGTFGSLPVGTTVEIVDVLSGWYKVNHASNTGYIMAEFLSVVENDEKPEDPADQPAPDLNQAVAELAAAVKELQEKLTRLENEWEDKMGWG